MVTPSDPVPDLAPEIARYFLRNPQAADTLEGIARWRLLDETVHRTFAQTGKALDWLVSRGYLRRRLGTTGAIFGLNEDRLSELRSFLSSRGED